MAAAEETKQQDDAAAAPEAPADDAQPAALQPMTFPEVVAPLAAMPEDQRSFSCEALVQCVARLQECRALLAARQPANETLADQERILATWLCGYFAGISGTPSIVRQDLLEDQLVASGIVAPFVQAGKGGNAHFGVPTNVTPDLLCDNVSELLRMAAAALLSLFTYLNFPQTSEDMPPDEVVLIFATIAINSCANAANAAAIDGQIAALFAAPSQQPEQQGQQEGHQKQQDSQQQEVSQQQGRQQEQQRDAEEQQQGQQEKAQQPQQQADTATTSAAASSTAGTQERAKAVPLPTPAGLRCAHIRWLMHWARSVVAHHMGSVAYLLADTERQSDCYTAQHKDQQAMVGTLPDHPLGYSLYTRTCMTFQQMRAAAAFLQRGLVIAKAAKDDANVASMAFQLAAATLLGGKGPEFEAGDVLELMASGEEARESVSTWWPQRLAGAEVDGEPDRSLLISRLLPEAEKRNDGSKVEAGRRLRALEGLLYVTAPPSSLPPGALVQQPDKPTTAPAPAS